MSADPLGVSGGFNFFGFNGLPTVTVDPLGLACPKKECVYVHEDKDGNVIYVGITDDFKRRAGEHRRDAAKTGLKMRQLTDYEDHGIARTIEGKLIRQKIEQAKLDDPAFDSSASVEKQLSQAGLQNKNRGRVEDNYESGVEPDDFTGGDYGKPENITTPP